MKKFYLVIPMVMILGIGIGLTINAEGEENLVPSWVKNTAKFWVEGQVSDTEFLNAIQFLINQGILTVEVPINEESLSDIDEVQESEHDVFPDSSKDPRYYLERYYTEPNYKAWFDKNYPDETIEAKIDYPSTIVSDDAYINNLFGFSLVPPSDWSIQNNPKTVDAGLAGIVSFSSSMDGPKCDYVPSFIIHFFKDDPIGLDSPNVLLNYYEDVIYFEESSQTKLTDSNIEKIPGGYKITYFFNDVGLFPEEQLDDGTICPEEFFTLQNQYVIFLYDDGDRFDIIFSSMPDHYQATHLEFEESIDTFKIGNNFEKLSDILNYE